MRTPLTGVLVIILALALTAYLNTSTTSTGLEETGKGLWNTFALSPIEVVAQVPGGPVWSLDLNNVVLVQRYVLPTPITNNITDLYLAIQNNFYGLADPEKNELLVLDNAILGNKTIDIYHYDQRDYKVSSKYGFLVFTNGTIYTWAWRQYYNDSDIALAFSWIANLNSVPIFDRGQFRMPTSLLISMLNNFFNSYYSKTYDTDPWSIAFSSDFYLPARPTASQFSIYYATLASVKNTFITRLYQVRVDSADYNEALLVVASKRFKSTVTGITHGLVRVYFNDTQVFNHSGPSTSPMWKVADYTLPLDTTIVIRVEYQASAPTLLLLLFR